MCSRRGVRDDGGGRANDADGKAGAISFSPLWLSPEQLLALDGTERGESGFGGSVTAAVAVVAFEVVEDVVMTESQELKAFSGSWNFAPTPAD